MTKMQTAKNASGDTFEIKIDHENRCFRAEQLTGLENNFMRIPVGLRATTRAELLSDLSKHWSNS